MTAFKPIDFLRLSAIALAVMAMLLTMRPMRAKADPLQIVLTKAESVTSEGVAQWNKEGFKALAVVLEDRASKAAYTNAAERASEGGLDLYYWIEVARNPDLAIAHPRWMASLGAHDDWQKNFPNLPPLKSDEVAKAFPWVPISYREAFDAHLMRIEQLLKNVPPGWRGLLLNDLQAGPSSCGCGNLQCRWAVDYRVRSTATKSEGYLAAKFVAEVGKRAGGRRVIPIWTTECEEVDLPANKRQGRPGTGLCGTVGCATSACPEMFSRQWSALVSDYDGPVGLLALHSTFRRTQSEFGGGPGWVTHAIHYLEETLSANKGKMISTDRLWVVLEDSLKQEEARKAAQKAGAGAIIVARTKIDQSYEPRMIPAE